MSITRLLTVGLFTAFLAACASSNSGSVYSRDEARKVQTVKTGVIESVRQVKLEGTKSPVGTIAGGAVGGIAGSSIGGDGTSGAIGAVIGAGMPRVKLQRQSISPNPLGRSKTSIHISNFGEIYRHKT